MEAGFIFLGVYWLGLFAFSRGYPVALGLLFVPVPGTLISIDRLTLDVALAALCVGFALYTGDGPPYRLFAGLAAAALSRETGFLLIAAYVLYLLGIRKFRKAGVFSMAAVPAVCWYLFVRLHVPFIDRDRLPQFRWPDSSTAS